MNEYETPDSAAPHPAVRDLAEVPAAFWAFHDQFKGAYRHYAELQLGDARVAGRVVHLVFLSLLQGWDQLMEVANPTASAWAQLREAVDEVLLFEGRDSALPEAASFARVSRLVLEDTRAEFAAMESALGLYPAIARLPARQFDVIVLQYVLEYTTARTARTMGVTEATVRSHRGLARHRLARELGQPLASETDEA